MKRKNFMFVTALLIALSAILLTTSLAFLHGSALVPTQDQFEFDEPTEIVDESISQPMGEIIAQPEQPTEDAPQEDGSENKPEDDGSEEEVPQSPKFDYPDFDYNLTDARLMHYCGCDQSTHGNSTHADLLRGVTIDVYSHKTGELVGQLALESEEIENYISKLFAEEFEPRKETCAFNNPEECLNLPEGDYRIEVYAGTWFSYTYGNDEMYELTQCTMTFFGGEKVIGYINYLINDFIAEIEAGNVKKPDPEMAVSKLEFKGLEGYWDGYWIENYEWSPHAGWTGYQWEGAGRFTERFPYIES